MQKHSENAMYLAHKFKDEGLNFVYPGLPSHRNFELFNKIRNADFGYGGMISIDLKTAEIVKKIDKNIISRIRKKYGRNI